MTAQPAPPSGSKASGRRLWRAVLADFDLDEHELVLLRQAVRTLDLCEVLQARVDEDGVLLDGRAHPAVVELRQQRILLTRLVASLRLPGEQGQKGTRTQYRGPRGAYQLRAAQ